MLRRFAGVDLGVAPAPHETTVLRFRYLLEKHDLCGAMLDVVNLHLETRGIRIATGTIVDATIIHAPSTTKNAKKQRDPEIHQKKKGNQWYSGLKTHIGVDASESHMHSVVSVRAARPLRAAQRAKCLDGRRSGGHSASDAQGPCFVLVPLR